jgi:hypothetical protein
MVTIKQKILGYKHDFVRFKNKIKQNMAKSEEYKAFKAMLAEIVLFGILGGLTYLVFVTDSLLIKFVGIGCGLFLFQSKILGWTTAILSSITLSKKY